MINTSLWEKRGIFYKESGKGKKIQGWVFCENVAQGETEEGEISKKH